MIGTNTCVCVALYTERMPNTFIPFQRVQLDKHISFYFYCAHVFAQRYTYRPTKKIYIRMRAVEQSVQRRRKKVQTEDYDDCDYDDYDEEEILREA